MTWWLLGAGILLVLFGIYLSMTAGRLDRLHHRVDTGLAALDAQFLRRSVAAQELVSSGLLDPGTSIVLANAASAAQMGEGDPHDRAMVESDLTSVLDAAFGDRDEVEALSELEGGPKQIEILSGACHRVELSRRFYNDAVRACRAVRRQRFVRWFSLAGHTPMPRPVEMDDHVPAGFQGL